MNDRAYASNGLPNGRYLPQQHGVPVAGQPAIAMHPDLAQYVPCVCSCNLPR